MTASGGPADQSLPLHLLCCKNIVWYGNLGEPTSSYSPYGTQTFFTCVACCRNQRPSACAGLNQSYAWPSLVHTCFRLPIEAARTKFASSLERKHQIASRPSCSARVLASSAGRPATRFTTPPGRSLVSKI